jgi:lipopolysaccharide/colanic/teichoic acid biosynthesis glycosyltransferase
VTALAVLLDTRPRFLDGGPADTSLLLAPLGASTVLRYLADRMAALGHRSVSVVADFEPCASYERRLREEGAPLNRVLAGRALEAWLDDCEPSDSLVVLDPRCVPTGDPGRMPPSDEDGPRRVQHLVALEHHPGGTTERVQVDAHGEVGRIQRYFDSATWPFTSGVASSVVPVSCLVGAGDVPFTSLRELRRALAARGVPSSDVFLRGGSYDLTRERDLLALSERAVLEAFAAGGRRSAAVEARIARGAIVDPAARLVGPVVVHEGARIGPRAVVVGPAVIGRGARIDPDALVAQCLLGPGTVVAAGHTIRHRAQFAATAPEPSPPAWEPGRALPLPPRVEAVAPSGRYPRVKTALDVAAAAAGLVALAPLLVAIAALVKLGSKGSVLYADRREGRGGRVFRCLKFRTMCAGADALQRGLLASNQVDGPQFKMAADPRITRLGSWLRRLNLDELPQLVNVVRREMSLVGPRPSPFRENQICIPWRDGRLSVRPGITGLWQVCRNRRDEGDFHQWIHYDLLYVRHMSLAVDLKILAATVLTLGGKWPVPVEWILPRTPTARDARAPRAAGLGQRTRAS